MKSRALDHLSENIMALHFAAEPKPKADKGLRSAGSKITGTLTKSG
jgi:hypothetical protein